MAVHAHAILEVRSGNGDLIWRFDRDGPKPRRVMPRAGRRDMNMMLNKVVEEGTGKRAMLDGIKAAGKTGTTNAYRDAWFVGYHRQHGLRRLVRQRRLRADQPHDRRLAAGHDLAADHGLRASGHRTEADRRCRARPWGRRPEPPWTIPGPRLARLLTTRGADVLVRIERAMEERRERLSLPPVAVRHPATAASP